MLLRCILTFSTLYLHLQGKLSQLVQLLSAMSFLSGGLGAMMKAYPAPAYPLSSPKCSHLSSTASFKFGGRGSLDRTPGEGSGGAAAGAGDGSNSSSSGRLPTAAATGSKQQQQQQWQQQQQQLGAGGAGFGEGAAGSTVTVDELLLCLEVAMQELPVWEGEMVEQVRRGCVTGGGGKFYAVVHIN
jgi:hypothetical protein